MTKHQQTKHKSKPTIHIGFCTMKQKKTSKIHNKPATDVTKDWHLKCKSIWNSQKELIANKKAVEFHQTSKFSSNSNYLQANNDLNNNVHDHDDELNNALLATNNVKEKITSTFKARTGWRNGSTIVGLRWKHLGKTYAFNTSDTSKHIGF